MGNWQNKRHSHAHKMEVVPAIPSSSSALTTTASPSRAQIGTAFTDFTAYCDSTRGVIVMFPASASSSGSSSSSSGSLSSSHTRSRASSDRHHPCLVFDLSTGQCLAQKMGVKTRADALCYSPVHSEVNGAQSEGVVYGIVGGSSKLERWTPVPLPPSRLEAPVAPIKSVFLLLLSILYFLMLTEFFVSSDCSA
jgi:hypothetical protein